VPAKIASQLGYSENLLNRNGDIKWLGNTSADRFRKLLGQSPAIGIEITNSFEPESILSPQTNRICMAGTIPELLSNIRRGLRAEFLWDTLTNKFDKKHWFLHSEHPLLIF
jgi:hypothetical protein